MGKPLYSSRLITENDVYDVMVLDISTPGRDGREFRIKVTDSDGIVVPVESGEVGTSNTWLATQRRSEIDLLALFIQFRDELPEVIHTATKSLFQYPKNDRKSKLYFVGDLIKTYFLATGHEEPLEPDYLRNSIKIEFGEILSILDTYISEGILGGYEMGSSSVIAKPGFTGAINAFLDTLVPVSWEDNRGVTIVPAPAEAKFTVKDPKVVMGGSICNSLMFDGAACDRPIFSNGKCIGHYDGEKDLADFVKCVTGVIDDPDICDFSGFIFPAEYEFPIPRQYPRRMIFSECQFEGYVNLRQCVFDEDVYFARCRFMGRVGFEFAHFRASFEMGYCEAPSVDLGYTIFESGFVFSGNKLMRPGGQGDQQLAEEDYFNLQGAIFQNAARVFIRGIRPNDIALRGCNLAQAGHIQLADLSRRSGESFQLADENPSIMRDVTHKPYILAHHRLVADCYQQLQRHLLTARNYQEAGGFHEREMEIRREHLAETVADHLLLSAYRLFAGYGESIQKPCWWLFALYVFIPISSMFLMGDLTYEWTGDPANIGDGFSGWFTDFVAHLRSFLRLDDSLFSHKFAKKDFNIGPWWHVILVFEKLATAVLVSFFIIAMRRRFRRY